MIADRATYQAVLGGRGVKEIEALWGAELKAFQETRKRYLLY